MKRAVAVLVVVALCAAPAAAAQDLRIGRVTKGPPLGAPEAFTEMGLSSADGSRAVFVSSEDITFRGRLPAAAARDLIQRSLRFALPGSTAHHGPGQVRCRRLSGPWMALAARTERR